ncbi:MAG: inositol monophosphatase [Gammaproteobacteria bacterium]|nr:inositol monophosphatase [Gammaproteobacteria bacterium]
MTDIIDFAKAAAVRAGDLIVQERSREALQRDFKGGHELVTQADLKADALITELIHGAFPDHLIMSEELAPDIGDVAALGQDLWIVDPIDGTVNYAHGHSQSAVSIAHARNGEIVAGVVYNPFTREMFWAENGSGAYLNDSPIEVAQETDPRRAIIATGFPYGKATLEPQLTRVAKILRECADIRRLGAASLDICWVAAGRLDGYYESLNLWDFAAAQLIAREAGAQYGHFRDVPAGVNPQFHCDDILVANPALFPRLRDILQDS